MTDISKESFIENGLDIAEALTVTRGVPMEMVLSGTLGYALNVVVQWLNDNGHERAAQALDDEWYSREDQWWRQNPDQYDQRYMHGEELLDWRDENL